MMFSIVLLYFMNRPFYDKQGINGGLRMFKWTNLGRVDTIVLKDCLESFTKGMKKRSKKNVIKALLMINEASKTSSTDVMEAICQLDIIYQTHDKPLVEDQTRHEEERTSWKRRYKKKRICNCRKRQEMNEPEKIKL